MYRKKWYVLPWKKFTTSRLSKASPWPSEWKIFRSTPIQNSLKLFEVITMWQGIINHYRKFLPVSDQTPVVTLNEGNTPLILSDDLSKALGLKVYLKYEGL